MPARRKKQSNAMLYTLITFIGLFIAATTIAVIYYVKAEEYRTENADLQRQRVELADDREYQARATIVGTKPAQKSWLGTVVDYLDETVLMVIGGVTEPTSAEVKVTNAKAEVIKALE